MKHVLYLIVFFLPLCAFANKNGTQYYVVGDKALKQEEYNKLSRKDRKNFKCSFRTIWKVQTSKDPQQPQQTRIDMLSNEITIIMFVDTTTRMISGSPFFDAAANSYKEPLKLKSDLKRKKRSFGGKKCYTGIGDTTDGKTAELITATYGDKRWRIIMIYDQKKMRLKVVRRAYAIFMQTFRFGK
ncbi:hypothetical protein [Candidatus Uabimicrobium amorphum]|uniref:Uncharacterized protein n=2 Tax=Uabimicrobium amorphum TaxID=2596890 RepID=A0A5S9IRA1_UABAM|nr:hypothetical protein UABAM_04840 [Candidatus Uabimicrobium amorphum]